MKRMLRRNKKNTTPRSLGCENLEDRRLLAVTVGDIAAAAPLWQLLPAVPTR